MNEGEVRAPQAHVLLVDDVLTSGATSTACVKVLKRAGARSVVIACFARVLDEALEHWLRWRVCVVRCCCARERLAHRR